MTHTHKMEEEPKEEPPVVTESVDLPPTNREEIIMHLQRMFSITPLDNIYGGIHFM